MTRATDLVSFARMSYVLEQTKQQQVLALGQLGWPVSRIAVAVHVDRATVTGYLRAAGLAVRGRGRPSEGTANAAISREVSTDRRANPAISPPLVSTDSAPSRAPRASACEPHRERIRGGGPGWPQCDGDSAGPRRRQRLHGPLCERPSLRPAAPAHRAAGRARRHRHHAGRGGAGRLRRRADGPPSGDGEIPTDAALCPDPRALTQSRAAADVAVERADVGGAPRARVSAPRGHAADGRPR